MITTFTFIQSMETAILYKESYQDITHLSLILIGLRIASTFNLIVEHTNYYFGMYKKKVKCKMEPPNSEIKNGLLIHVKLVGGCKAFTLLQLMEVILTESTEIIVKT